MPKAFKISIIAVFFLAVIAILFNPLGWNMPWGNTETSISTEPNDIDALNKKYKAYRDSVETANKLKIEEMRKMQEKIDAANEEAAANKPPANQIATPVAPANPADSTVVTIPVKKKSGVGG
jgi:hypothetical protein